MSNSSSSSPHPSPRSSLSYQRATSPPSPAECLDGIEPEKGLLPAVLGSAEPAAEGESYEPGTRSAVSRSLFLIEEEWQRQCAGQAAAEHPRLTTLAAQAY